MAERSVLTRMKLLILLSSVFIANTNAQANLQITQTKMAQCFNRQGGGVKYRWCVKADGTSLTTDGFDGYCCPDDSTDPTCTHGSEYSCTLNNSEMPQNLWATYIPGVNSALCGGTLEISAEEGLNGMEATPVVKKRAIDG